MTWEDGFRYLLHPMEAEHFFEHYWEAQRPVHIPGTPEKFQGLFGRAAFERTLREVPPNQSLHVRAAYRNAAGGDTEVGCVGAEEALRHFAAGATLCASAVDIADANLARLRDSLQRELRLPDPLFFHCYYSPDGQGFATHFDSQEGWILQLEGVKDWQYSTAPAYPAPSIGGGPQHAGRKTSPDDERIAGPAESTLVDVSLNPGDVLYLPPGTWHRASARGYSLALTLCQPHVGHYAVLVDKLLKKLLARREWRLHVPRLAKGLPRIVEDLDERLAELKALVDELTIVDVCDAWYAASFSDQRPAAAETAPPDRGDRFQKVPGSQLLWFESMDSIRVYSGGAKYSVSLEAEPLLRSIDSGDIVTLASAADLCGMSAEAAGELLRQFLETGVVSRV